jgi:hypothetical protein
MPVPTYIDQAGTRVQAEQDVVAEKIDAFDAFIDRVAELPTDPTPSSAGMAATTGTQLRVDSATDDHCRTVRKAFDETVRPHSVAEVGGSESLLETMREELTDTIVLALAPTTDVSFGPELKQMVISRTQDRRAEATALHEALGREEVHLTEVGAAVDDITAWIVEANETPLTDLDFDALKRRHETLASHRDRCETLAHRRQQFLRETTNNGIEAGVRHERLIPYLYQDFPVDHPVLARVTKLDGMCDECQRIVRDHLVRRA